MQERVEGGRGRTAARVVPVVARRGSRTAAAALATLLGFWAGLLLYVCAALAFAEPALRLPDGDFVLAVFAGGWVLGALLLGWRTASLLLVARRGLLLGTAQWLALAPLVGTLPRGALPRAGELLSRSLGGPPLALPNAAGALLLAALCLLGAMALTALPSALGVRLAEPAR